MKFRYILVTVIVMISLFVVGISTESYISNSNSVQDGNNTPTDSISGAEQSGTDASSSTETDTDTDLSSTETATDASTSTETPVGTESELTPSNDQTTDSDSDGLSDEREAELGTDPELADSDGDGLEDGSELNEYGTDPTSADSDSDGLNDGEEVTEYGTFPLSPDSDGDGLSDLEEEEYGTNATNPDTDGDGLPDGAEVNSEALSESDPLRKDVFVEVDYMQSYKPREETMNLVEEAYEEAPIENPDGSTGISLHIILDESIETESTTDSEQKISIMRVTDITMV